MAAGCPASRKGDLSAPSRHGLAARNKKSRRKAIPPGGGARAPLELSGDSADRTRQTNSYTTSWDANPSKTPDQQPGRSGLGGACSNIRARESIAERFALHHDTSEQRLSKQIGIPAGIS